jgi:hypothetical protein
MTILNWILKWGGVVKAVMKFVVYEQQVIDLLRKILLHEVDREIDAQFWLDIWLES